MVHHIVLWDFLPELSKAQKEEAGDRIRRKLERVGKTVPGVTGLKVIINELDSSSRDIALIAEFESLDALNAYQIHPDHIDAGTYIKSVTCGRVCFDY